MAQERGSLPSTTPLGAVADVGLDRIAALVRTVLHVPVGLVSLVDRDGQVFPGQAGLPAPWSETRSTPLTHSFCQYVVRTREPLVIADARLDPQLRTNLAIVDIDVIAYAGVPLIDRDGMTVGSLCAIDTVPREWTDEEVGLLGDLAAACSAELQLRSAARASDEARTLSSALLEFSETLSGTLTTADISQAVSKLATGRLGATFGGITVLDEAYGTLTYVDLGALPGSARAKYRLLQLSDPMPSPTAARERRAFFFESVEQVSVLFPEAARALRDSGSGAGVYLPLGVADRVVGTVAILWEQPRTFDDADRALLLGLCRYTAQAVERATLLHDRRDVAETLQAAMLPRLPVVSGVELVARYLPARRSNAVGGDWYDAFPLADDRLMVSVGDVQGHDTAAAAAMGQVRSMLRAFVSTGADDPAHICTSLDHVMTTARLGRFATGLLASVALRPDGASALVSNAGHPRPLVISPGQPPQFLDCPPDRPLGMGLQTAQRRARTFDLPAGSTVLLFTDGLVERHGVELADALEHLRDTAGRYVHLELADLLDAILAELLVQVPDDDVVLFGMRVDPAD